MELSEAIQYHSPLFYLHSDEAYFPIAPNTYVAACGLKLGEQWVKPQELTEGWTVGTTLEHSLMLSPGHSVVSVMGNCRNLHDIPVYVDLYHPPGTCDYYVHYIQFYGFSGPYQPLCCIPQLQIGAHLADIEHITYHYKSQVKDVNTEVSLNRVYCSAHEEGEWHPLTDLAWEGSHPVFYVARYSHATYATMGHHRRICGLLDDECNSGYRWDSSHFIKVPSINEEWARFPGTWGESEVRGLPGKTWFQSDRE